MCHGGEQGFAGAFVAVVVAALFRALATCCCCFALPLLVCVERGVFHGDFVAFFGEAGSEQFGERDTAVLTRGARYRDRHVRVLRGGVLRGGVCSSGERGQHPREIIVVAQPLLYLW